MNDYNFKDHYLEVKEWYDGYHFGNTDIYCPWDVIQYCKSFYLDGNKADVRTPALFQLMQKTGNISEHDMFNTFNMGVGMVLTVPAEQADKALEILHANGEPEAYRLGVIAEGEGVELC